MCTWLEWRGMRGRHVPRALLWARALRCWRVHMCQQLEWSSMRCSITSSSARFTTAAAV